MLELPQKIFETIQRKLLRQKKELEKNLKALDVDDPVKGDSLAESSESGTDSWLAEVHSKSIALKTNLQSLLQSTIKALGKFRKGNFGKCENCGKPIEVERLEAIPTATLCLVCSKKSKK